MKWYEEEVEYKEFEINVEKVTNMECSYFRVTVWKRRNSKDKFERIIEFYRKKQDSCVDIAKKFINVLLLADKKEQEK